MPAGIAGRSRVTRLSCRSRAERLCSTGSTASAPRSLFHARIDERPSASSQPGLAQVLPYAENLLESLRGSRLCFGCLLLAIFGGGGRFERVEEAARYTGDVLDSRHESGFVCPGWFVVAADFPDELQRCSINLFLCDWRFQIVERANVSTHAALPPC